MNDISGINAANLQKWFDPKVGGLDGPLTFTPVTGGHSNLTYRVADSSGRQWVLRRPPLGHVLATAHDMGREHRIISALSDSGVPVPGIIGLCQDTEVNDAPFYVMDFVPGVILRLRDEAEEYSVEARQKMGHSLIETLARIHSVDVDTVGLGDLARRDGYIERQLKRWRRQFVDATSREIPQVLSVHDTLAACIPEQQGVSLVHGDYRLDNCMMNPEGPVAAVLDWEISTLGDALADVGGIISSITDQVSGANDLASRSEGFPTADEIREIYGTFSDRNLEHLDFYVAFNYWRMACIIEGVYSRYVAGVMGEIDDVMVKAFGERVVVLADLAAETAATLS
ncbi:MAG: phosphotransferase family protein [Actinobacteria bacterium]|jgi:aminoglycoside phosphotransferase (APT) family kinase protein|nr:phosphotransferase family protein [Actinomycetota bacterium]MBT3746969.1 phosphotransferase family protein [Actinomycetota bacterium]MBT3970521.1 phosphotransferase family protein [Actinomycetota bacterium]MBT4010381.1 phosphotransferase family protein [Actinomycetota bacterium]MBT4302778.1 phosphotransferase family protein [Actinomycetota bacterium]